MRWIGRVLTAAALLGTVHAHAQDKVVNVYNWTDYIDPKVLEAFTAQTGIKVQYDVYDSLETLEGKLLAGKSGYDVVVPTAEPTFSRLIKAGALQPLDKAKIPNLKAEDPALTKRVETSDPGNKYGGIYLWGTLGLGVVPSKIKALAPDAPIDSWDLLLKPEWAKKLAPCGIVLMDSAIDTIPSVLKYLGKDPDSADPKDLEAVEKTLMAIRPYIRTFASGGALEMLASNEICLAMDYSGDVVQAASRAAEAKKDEVDYVLPKQFTQVHLRHARRAQGRTASGIRDAVHQLHSPARQHGRHHQQGRLPQCRAREPADGRSRREIQPERLPHPRDAHPRLHRQSSVRRRRTRPHPHVGPLQSRLLTQCARRFPLSPGRGPG